LRHLQALTGDPHFQRHACALRAAIYERLAKPEEADREQRRLGELPADQPWPDINAQIHEFRVGVRGRIARAEFSRKQHKLEEALHVMNKTIERYPESDLAWAALGVAKENLKDF